MVIPHYSFIGCAITTILSQIILVAISAYFIRKELDIWQAFAKMCYFIIVALIAIFAAIFVKDFFHFEKVFFTLATSGMAFGVIYLFAWFILKKFLKKIIK